MRTILHAYHFDTTNPDEKTAWETLRGELKAQGLRCFEAIGDYYYGGLDGATIELETKHLFNNQWNAAPITGDDKAPSGRRLFDWALDSIWVNGRKNTHIKRGHWIEQTAEMRETRRNTVGCHYCGAQEPAQKGYVFCPHCIDSEYLTGELLHITRMKPIDDTSDCAPLTDAESAHLLPLFRDAQLHGATERGKARIAKARQDVETDYARTLKHAKVKHDGFLWLMDHSIRTDNVIYYSHTGRFGFGWRQPVDDAFRSALLDVVSEFPFPYDIKCADGRTLSGE